VLAGDTGLKLGCCTIRGGRYAYIIGWTLPGASWPHVGIRQYRPKPDVECLSTSLYCLINWINPTLQRCLHSVINHCNTVPSETTVCCQQMMPEISGCTYCPHSSHESDGPAKSVQSSNVTNTLCWHQMHSPSLPYQYCSKYCLKGAWKCYFSILPTLL